MTRHKQQAVATEAARESHAPASVGLTNELAAVLASCNEHLLDLQKQATEIAFAKAAAVQAAWLRAVNAMVALLPQERDRADTARMIEIVSGWFQVVTQTQTALIQILGEAALAGSRDIKESAPHNRPQTAERRKLAVVINFPDRRRAA